MIQKMLAEERTREAVDAVEAVLPSLATHAERSRNATEGPDAFPEGSAGLPECF
jgi:hypothetical protein